MALMSDNLESALVCNSLLLGQIGRVSTKIQAILPKNIFDLPIWIWVFESEFLHVVVIYGQIIAVPADENK